MECLVSVNLKLSEINMIIEGDVISVLKTLDSDSVQCVITSPPYYGLRDYGTTPQVWDGDKDCDHIWGDFIKNPKAETRDAETKRAQGATVGGSIIFNKDNANGNSGKFCTLCNAWCGELGLEPSVNLYIDHLIQIFKEVYRVLKPDGTCFVNIGDSYSGSNGAGYTPTKWKSLYDGNSLRKKAKRVDTVKRKSLMNIPHRFAIKMTDELGFILRNEITWHKVNAVPSSAKDRFSNDSEPVFFFTKNPKYKFNQQLEPYTKPMNRWGGETLEADGEGLWDEGTGQNTYRKRKMRPNPKGRNKRTVWSLVYEPQKVKHWAGFPTKLVEPMILAGSSEGDIVMDIFSGSGTTGIVALQHNRKYLGIELQSEYVQIQKERFKIKLDYEVLHTKL